MKNNRTLLLLQFLITLLLFNSNLAFSDILRLATTTSTVNSGLLKQLLPAFEKQTGHKVHVIAVGTGRALRMGQAGDADVVLVHSRKAEDEFVEAKHGVNHRSVMYNDFVIVGPAHDPAKITGIKNSVNALKRIQQSQSLFISRGDTSGTHKKELSLWKQAKIKPAGKWYREAGQGMGKVLQIASELSGYTLTDRGTWLSSQKNTSLTLLHQGDKRLFNPYGIIAVSPDKYHDINYIAAMSLIAWITSPSAQTDIANYRINNTVLFKPMAVLSQP